MNRPSTSSLWIKLLLPFAAGYFLSYLYRTVNAVIGPVLAGELGLDDSSLGLLTSTYFLAFGAAQLPLGMLLDRYGPRRVEATLLLIAASGAVVFALADGLSELAVGRALIGLGVSACLMAAFKAFAQWFPPEKFASLTGWVMTSGALGALVAAQPVQFALGMTGWREICLGLAAATLLIAILLWVMVPDKPGKGKTQGFADQLAGVRHIFGSRHFWRYVPIAFSMSGGFMALQGLWVSRWMSVIEGMERSAIAERLTFINLAMLAGFVFMGFFSTRLARRGISPERIYLLAMVVNVCSFAAICAAPTAADGLLWAVLGFCFAFSNIVFSLVAKSFPEEFSGRANTALNLSVASGAFLLQWGVGSLADGLQRAGWSAGDAFRTSFVVLLVVQLAALLWMLKAVAPRS